MKIKFLLMSTFLLYASNSMAQVTLPTSDSDSSILVNEEILVPLPISNSNIHFNISASGKSATEANAVIEAIKKKLEMVLVGSSTTVLNRNFSGGSGAGEKLSATAPILINEEISVIVSEASLMSIVDSLLAIPQVKISSVSPLKDNLFDLKTQMSSKVVKLALQKANVIAKDQSMLLGDIIDLSVTEEPTPASIREQLEPNKDGNLSNLSETKIVASLRVKLKRK